MNWKFFVATRTRKITTITIGTLLSLFLLYVLVGFLVIAPVAKWQLEEQLPPLIQRKVTIEKVRLNPLTLRVEFDKIAIKKKDGNGNLFSVTTFEAQLSPKSILALAPIVQHVRIVEPKINVTRYKDDSLSIDDILEHQAKLAAEAAEKPDSDEDKKDQRIFPFKVLNLILENGDIVFNDEKEDAVQTISKFSLAIPLASSFESDLKEAVTPKLSMLINGTPFDLDGSTYPFSDNLLTKFSFATDDISLARYWRYFPFETPVALTSGDMKISVNLGFSRPVNQPIDLHVDGVVELKKLVVTKKDKAEVLSIPRFTLKLKDFSLAERKVFLESIEIDSPYVEVHRQKDNSINWATYFVPPKDVSAETGSKNVAKSAAKSTTKSATKSVTKSATKTATKSVTKVTDKPVDNVKSTDKVTPTGEAKPTSNVKPATKSATKSPTKSATKTATKSVTKATDKPVANVKTSDEVKSTDAAKTADNVKPANTSTPVIDDSVSPAPSADAKTKDQAIAQDQTKTVVKSKPVQDATTTPTADKKSEEEKDHSFTVILESFSIKKGKVLFKDSTVPGTFSTTLAPIDIVVKNITTEPTKSADVSVVVGEKKMIEVVGGVGISPVTANLKATINNLGLAQFMPYIAAATPAKIGSGALNAAAEIQISTSPAAEILVNIANGNIKLQDLALTGKNFKKAPIILKTLAVDGANIDLKKQSVAIGNIGFLGPDITITRSKDGIDIISLLVAESPASGAKPLTKDPKPVPKKASGGSSWKLRIQGVAVKNGKITLHDTALKKTVITSLKDVAITASDITLDNKPSAFSVSTGVNAKSTIKAKGTFAHSPLAVDGDVNVKNLNIPDFAEYINEYSEVTISKGTVDATAKGKLSVPETGDTQIKVAADVTVNNLSADSNSVKEHIGSVQQISVKKAEFDSASNSAKIQSIAIEKPETEVILERNGSTNIARAVQGKPKNGNPQKAARGNRGAAIQATTKPFGISIGSISIRNGAVTFQDASISPKVVLDIENIAVKYKQFSLSSRKPSPVDFSATLQGRKISATGTVNPMASPLALNMILKLDDIGLDKFSPYTVKYIAYPVKTGSLNAYVKLKIQQNKLNAENKLLFEDFTLGERNAQSKAPSVPIKLGLSLMREPNGDISLTLPVTGNLKDPNFHLNQIITKTLVNIIVKAAVSPFTLLGSLIGDVSPEEAQYITFKPGSALVPKSDIKILTKIASVLKTKTSITLECLGHYNTEIDVKGLRDRALSMAVKKEWYDTLSSATQRNIDIESAAIPKYNYEKYLKAAYENAPEGKNDARPSGVFGYQDQSVQQMEEYLRNSVDTSHEALRKLSLDRAEAVRKVIIGNSPKLEGRVKAIQAGASKKDSHATSVQLQLRQ